MSRQRQSVTGILPFGHYSRSSEPLCARTKDNAGRLRQAVVAREGAQRGQTPWQKTLIVLEKVGRLGRHSADGTAWNYAGRWRPRRWLGRRNVSHGGKSTHRKCEKRKKEKKEKRKERKKERRRRKKNSGAAHDVLLSFAQLRSQEPRSTGAFAMALDSPIAVCSKRDCGTETALRCGAFRQFAYCRADCAFLQWDAHRSAAVRQPAF